MGPNLAENEKVMKKYLLKSLKMSQKNGVHDDDNDMICVFPNFDDFSDSFCTGKSDIVDQFKASEKVILKLESSLGVSKHKRNRSFLWEESMTDEARQYLLAVDSVLRLTVLLSDGDLKERVDGVVQKAMLRLENQFRHILIRERDAVPLDGEGLCGRLSVSIRRNSHSFASNDGASEDLESSVDDESESLCEEGRGSLSDDLCLELVTPKAVLGLKEIAERMIRTGYEKECCQVYSSVRRDTLFEFLSVLGVEKMSFEEINKLEWGLLDEKMKKWIKAVKIVFRYLLDAEKRLCEKVFGDSERIREVCFTETAKECVTQLISFGEAIATVQRSPEKLFRILDMYEALDNVCKDLKILVTDDLGDFVRTEVQSVLDGLREAAKGTFLEFENAVQGESSRKVTHGAEIHPLGSYVMNYIKLLVDYSDSLRILLDDSKDRPDRQESDVGPNLQLDTTSPMGRRLLLIISSLETNLEIKSKAYEDSGMRYIFLMNNILYIVQKVKNSDLGKLLGDHWVRKRRSQVRQYATCYLRASWSKVLSFLKDEGLVGSGSLSNISKVALKERFKKFNTAFEEIYKTQSGWKVPDSQLRDELRMSISERVLPAYRSFMGRFRSHLESGRHAGRYIKYTPEDIENYLVDLFEGSPGDLHNPKRKVSK